MKKIFTFLMMTVMTLAANAADITIYVQADVAPYLYAWGGGANNGSWPGTQMTETAVVQGTTFWKKSFSTTGSLNIIFNNGSGAQTSDITGITTDRYFTYNGATSYTDISEQYIEVPDAEIESVAFAGTNNGWNSTSDMFTEVEANKTYTFTLDTSDNTDGYVDFKMVVNGSAWVGFYQVTVDAPSGWIIEAVSDSNFELDLDAAEGVTKFLFTATWEQGKKADENWTLKVEDANNTGIEQLTTATATGNEAIYNLAGQRVSKNYRGIAIMNGKKVVLK